MVIDFAPAGVPVGEASEFRQLGFDASGYVQMELLGREPIEGE